jgi:hypothetical protein
MNTGTLTDSPVQVLSAEEIERRGEAVRSAESAKFAALAQPPEWCHSCPPWRPGEARRGGLTNADVRTHHSFVPKPKARTRQSQESA